MIRTDYEGMTLNISGVKDDMDCSQYYPHTDRVMEALVDKIHSLTVEYDMEIQEIATHYYMVENDEHLGLLEDELELLLEELQEELEEMYEELEEECEEELW